MKYMMLIYSEESAEPQPGSGDFGSMMQRYGAFAQEVSEKGKMVAGDPLESVATATTVRVREGKTQTVDGPFAETKEQLAGFFILDCTDLDEAIEYAAKIPTADFGSIEIRPIRQMGG